MALVLSSRHIGKVYIIQCKGRIAMGDEVMALEAELRYGTREFRQVVLNVAHVERLDSTGIGLLVRHATNLQKARGDIRLAEAPAFIVTLLKLANLSKILRVYETEEAAILSFLEHQPAHKVEKHGTRVLFFDQSPDLCAFVRAVLTQHGYDVKWTCNFGDAKILLRVETVDYLLVGPGTPQLTAETALRGLRAVAPKSLARHLSPDFKIQDAHVATASLLELFKGADASGGIA
jgi:anti-anti-sigma factor